MREEMEANLPRARVGRGSKYRTDASFVLKILPHMDRDKRQVDKRMAASMAVKRKGRWLTRRQIPPGTAGYLYVQARALLSGVENQPGEMAAISLSDFTFGDPQIVGVEDSPVDRSIQVSAKVPASYQKPSDRELMMRMGTALVAGMSAAFSCEVGMKAILLTRRDAAEATHNLLTLYQALPSDVRERLEADFLGIGDALNKDQEAFGKWRYFEEESAQNSIAALVNTDRVRRLAKAARAIVDECVIVGLQFQPHVAATLDVEGDGRRTNLSQRNGLTVDVGEAAIPWPEVLASDRDAPDPPTEVKGRIPDFPVTRSHPPASWPSAANSSICRTYRKTAGEESRRRSPVANRWMRP